MNTNSHKVPLVLRYLFLILHYLIPFFIRIILVFPASYLFVWLSKMDGGIIKILILIVSFVILSFVLPLIFTGIRKLGEFSMRICPDRVSFWIVLVLICISYIFFFTKNNYYVGTLDTNNNVIAYLPKYLDIIITGTILTIYGFFGNLYNSEDDNKDDKSVASEDKDITKDFLHTVKDVSTRGNANFVYALRDLAFEDHAVLGGLLITALENKKDNPLKEFWLKIGGSEEEIHGIAFIPKIAKIKAMTNVFILEMPKPKLPTESLYIGFCLDNPQDIRIYTLELMQNKEYALCMWNDFSHNLIKKDLKPDLEEFYQAILQNYDKSEVEGRYFYKEMGKDI